MKSDQIERARRPRMVALALTAACLATVIAVAAPSGAQASARGETAPGYQIPLYASSGVGTSVVPAPAARIRAARAATINVSYHGFTAAAQASFQRAVNIIKAQISSPIAIKIDANYTNLGNTGILGSAGPTTVHRNFANAPKQNVWFVSAAANKRAGTDLNGAGTPEISARFNNQFPNWHFGTAAPPANKYDFQTVVLHEIIHGLGLLSGIYQSGSSIRWDVISGQPYPLITGTYVVTASGTKLTSLANGSNALKTAATSGNVFFNGPKAKLANSGNKPRMYAPRPFESGSSLSHWDENTYPKGNPNSLMTPFLSMGERIANPGAFTIGALKDSGW